MNENIYGIDLGTCNFVKFVYSYIFKCIPWNVLTYKIM